MVHSELIKKGVILFYILQNSLEKIQIKISHVYQKEKDIVRWQP